MIIESVKMIMSNVDGNNNKFWNAEVTDNGDFLVVNGRVGSAGQKQPVKSFGNQDAAIRYMQKKINEKEKTGYKRFIEAGKQVSSSLPASVMKKEIEDIAAEQIRTDKNSDVIAALIKKMAQANIHNILNNTTMSYNASTGYFSTPLGLVTRNSISQARVILNSLSGFVGRNDFESELAKKALCDYLMLIPQKVPSKLTVKGVLPNMEAIEKQHGILDSLIDSIEQAEIMANNPEKKEVEKEVPKIFNAFISLVDDSSVIKQIEKMYSVGYSRTHASSELKVSRVFQISIDKMTNDFDKNNRSTDNVMRLWHGTRVGNILSIIKSGFIIEPESAGHVCGRMYGNGLYFSDQSTKSLNYSYGFWDNNKKDNVCYMFVCEVAMGKIYYPKHSDSSLHKFIKKNGYDSSFAEANKSGVRNNEMIVYETNRVKPVYLVEFTK